MRESSFENIIIYPNPTHDTFTLSKPQHASDVFLSIYSSTGNLISKSLLPYVKSAKMDISGFSPGIYLVQIESENHVEVHRLIVQ